MATPKPDWTDLAATAEELINGRCGALAQLT